jgi:ribosomal protein S6--L-glutamate ligase
MKAALISQGSTSSEWTAEAMRKYFDAVDMINLKDVEVKLGEDGGVYHKDKPFEQYDCVYAKGSFRYANLLAGITTLLHGKCYMPIGAQAFNIVHHKLFTHLELQKRGIPMPRTYIMPTIESAKLMLKSVNYPVVMKFPEGTQGKGVMFADSYSSASSMLDALGALKQPFIIQEYIDTGDTDIRALVVGEQVVAGMMRVASGSEKRANIHAGGEGKPYELDRQERKIALDTAKALGTNICGVDMLRGPRGPLVLEANISPGLQGITAATHVDVADKIARFLHQQTEVFTGVRKREEAKEIMKDKLMADGKEIITSLTFKGERVLLPSMITNITKFSEDNDYVIKAEKGKLSIEEFKVRRG